VFFLDEIVVEGFLVLDDAHETGEFCGVLRYSTSL
jgi:hypothetical protein